MKSLRQDAYLPTAGSQRAIGHRRVSAARVALVALIQIWSGTTAQSSVLISTLGQPGIMDYGFLAASDRIAVDFMTGSTATDLDSLTLRASNFDHRDHSLVGEIWSNSGGLPGVYIGTIGNALIPAESFSFANYTTSGGGGGEGSFALKVRLDSLTPYWLVIRAEADSELDSPYLALANTQAADSGGTFLAREGTQTKLSGNSGTTWFNTTAIFNPLTGEHEFPGFKYSLSGSAIAVPEPAGCVVAAVGLLAVTAFLPGARRRHRNSGGDSAGTEDPTRRETR